MPDVTRAQVVAEARSHLDARWVHQGRRPGVAVDCAGLLVLVGQSLGLTRFDLRDYDRLPDGRLLQILRRELEEIPSNTIQPGDVVALAYELGPSHVGIVADYQGRPGLLSIIHASNVRRAVCEHRLDLETRKKVLAAFRVPGVVD